jgi:hypothetical protein
VKGLVWKELREWGPLSLAVLIVLCVGWCLLADPTRVLIAPSAEPAIALLATACGFGVLLGYLQLHAERSRGTLPYVVHREGGRRAFLRGKLAVGSVLSLGVAVLPPLVYLAQQYFGALGPVIQPERALELAVTGLAVLPAYASGMFIAQIAPNGFLRFAHGLFAVGGCMLYSLWLPLPAWSMSAWSQPLFALGQLALAAALFSLARAFFLRGHDRDALLPFSLQAGSALYALLLVVLPAWWAFSNSVREGRQSLFNSYPLLVRDRDRHYGPMERREYDERARSPETERIEFTMPNGTVATEPIPSLVYNPAPPLELSTEHMREIVLREVDSIADLQRWSEFPVGRSNPDVDRYSDKRGRRIRTYAPAGRPGSGGSNAWYLDHEQGIVRQFLQLDRRLGNGGREPPPPTQAILHRPDGRSFSRSTLIIADGMEPSLLVDRDDNTIWTLDFADEGIRLAELSLPDGNRLVGVQSKQQAPQLNHWNFYYVHEPILVGSISSYQWTVAGFVKSDTPAARPWWLRYCTSEVGETSLAEMTVRLRKIDENGAVGTDSEIVFEQRYEPRNLREHGRVALMRFGMLCGRFCTGCFPGLRRCPRTSPDSTCFTCCSASRSPR